MIVTLKSLIHQFWAKIKVNNAVKKSFHGFPFQSMFNISLIAFLYYFCNWRWYLPTKVPGQTWSHSLDSCTSQLGISTLESQGWNFLLSRPPAHPREPQLSDSCVWKTAFEAGMTPDWSEGCNFAFSKLLVLISRTCCLLNFLPFPNRQCTPRMGLIKRAFRLKKK